MTRNAGFDDAGVCHQPVNNPDKNESVGGCIVKLCLSSASPSHTVEAVA